MANQYFRFKQFTIRQKKTPFKVGTDGVLLGAWADCDNVQSILDVGTGTGLLAMMMAQRCDAMIDAIEPNDEAFQQASENIQSCPWPDRIKIHHRTLQDFSSETPKDQYDMIICNPPFFSNSLKNTDMNLAMARHDDMLTSNDLLLVSNKLLHQQGKLVMIYPAEYYTTFISIAHDQSFYVKRERWIKPNTSRKANRVMMEMTGSTGKILSDSLSIRNAGTGEYTPEYKDLTGHFYLHF